jgi:hypothetical protein
LREGDARAQITWSDPDTTVTNSSPYPRKTL